MNPLGKAALALAAAGAGAFLLSKAARRRPRYDFRGRVVLITGGSRGLGLELARQFADEGARVALCARDGEELQRGRADLALHNTQALTHPCDVSSPQQVQDLVRAVEANLGPIDVLVNNAGIIAVGPLSAMTREDYEAAMNTHFWGAYNTIDAVAPGMRQRRAGRIVNVSSFGGKVGVPHLAPYCASKFALVGYTQALRAELADDGITVTLICPGLMRTGSPRNAFFKSQNEAEYAWFKIGDSIPGFSTASDAAARRIIEASRDGEAEVTLTLPAKAAVRFQALFPDAFAELVALANRLLPGFGGIGTAAKRGAESETALTESPLTRLTRNAAAANNEVAPAER
jgi:NAD(P)-dependent dehydrogenase (short-subunit alcohol dehydrogenase family)